MRCAFRLSLVPVLRCVRVPSDNVKQAKRNGDFGCALSDAIAVTTLVTTYAGVKRVRLYRFA